MEIYFTFILIKNINLASILSREEESSSQSKKNILVIYIRNFLLNLIEPLNFSSVLMNTDIFFSVNFEYINKK